MMAGLGGGILETLIMGFADFQLSVPLLILIVTVIAVLGSSPTKLAVVIGISYWVGYARISRVIALSLREREFVLASRTQGAGAVWIMRKHILPSIIPQLWIVGSFNVGALVIVEASLSYLGLGVQAPQASLGGMIFDGQAYLTQDSWLCIIPGIVIFMIVAGVQIASTQFTDEGAPHRVGMSEGVS
jgi:peptide/nickel transport system permease protein